MIGFPITYGDILDKSNGFTRETVVTEISDYWSNEENQVNFTRGYKFGLFIFGISGVILTSRVAVASDSRVQPGVVRCLDTD